MQVKQEVAAGVAERREEVATAAEQLWLLDRTTGSAAKVVVKHQRCKQTGRWGQRRIGPYGNHSACAAAGSHVSACGRRLCSDCA